MKRKGPDSLEGLFIAAIICSISTLMFGTAGLSGMLFVACITRYNTNRNDASFPFMLSNVLQAVTGPLAGYFAQRFSVRAVILTGSILSFLGIGTCYFAEDITTVTVLWGIVFGTGLGLSTLLLPVIINDYFIKQRSKALGMCYLGSPIGFFVFPPIFEVLLEKYGLSGCFLFLAGINMHCIPLSMLLKRPNFDLMDEKSLLNSDEEKHSYSSTDSRKSGEIEHLEYETCEKSLVGKSEVNKSLRRYSIEVLWNPTSDPEILTNDNHQCKLVLDKKCSNAPYSNPVVLPSYKKTSADHCEILHNELQCVKLNGVFKYHEYEQIDEKVQPHVADSEELCFVQCSDALKDGDSKKSLYHPENKIYANCLTLYVRTDQKPPCSAVRESDLKSASNHRVTSEVTNTQRDRHSHYKDFEESDKSGHTSLSILSIPETPTLLSYKKVDGFSNNPEDRCNDNEKNATPSETRNTDNPKKKSLLDMYLSPVFILICIINGLTNLCFGTLSTIIIDFSRDHQTHPSYDKYIMMCIALMGAVGMLGFGWVTDGGHLTLCRFAALCQIIGCVCASVLPLTSGFVSLIIPLALWCVCQSSFTPLIPAITAEHIKGEFQAVAITACNVLSGPLYLIIPPLIGYFRDEKGSYDNIFYLLGTLTFVNSIAIFVIPYLDKWRDKT